MSNFVSSNNANALFDAVGKKKLTVTDVMPLAASAANEGIPYLYLGATTQDYTNGSIYKCQEVTPATDPKTYEFVEKYKANVDLSKYKRIWGGTEAAWEQLTDEEKAQYDYEFFEGDTNDYFAVVDAVTDGDMHPVTSNAVYQSVDALDAVLSADTGWIQPNNSVYFYYRVLFGKIVFIRTDYVNTNIPVGSLGITIPSAYCPSVRIDFADGTNNGGYLQIETNGQVSIGSIASGQRYFKVDACYLIS